MQRLILVIVAAGLVVGCGEGGSALGAAEQAVGTTHSGGALDSPVDDLGPKEQQTPGSDDSDSETHYRPDEAFEDVCEEALRRSNLNTWEARVVKQIEKVAGDATINDSDWKLKCTAYKDSGWQSSFAGSADLSMKLAFTYNGVVELSGQLEVGDEGTMCLRNLVYDLDGFNGIKNRIEQEFEDALDADGSLCWVP